MLHGIVVVQVPLDDLVACGNKQRDVKAHKIQEGDQYRILEACALVIGADANQLGVPLGKVKALQQPQQRLVHVQHR